MKTKMRLLSRSAVLGILTLAGAAFSAVAAAECVDTNTCVGEGALSDPVGNGNSAFGFNALAVDASFGFNTAVGYIALSSNDTGAGNTGIGERALRSNTTGNLNTALGSLALQANSTGELNTAVGTAALSGNMTGLANTSVGQSSMNNNFEGSNNTAVGSNALDVNWSGNENTTVGYQSLSNTRGGSFNTASGSRALRVAQGSRNVALGYKAGHAITTGSDNIIIGAGVQGSALDSGVIRIGNSARQKKTVIGGIRGVKTGLSNATAVYIDGNGQLGTIQSSRVVKEDIRAIGSASERLAALHPVTFRYKNADEDGSKPLQYGLIAEDVAEIFPELVVYDAHGTPETVSYHLLSTLLLNEFQKQQQVVQAQEGRIAELERRLAELAAARR